MVKPKMIQQIIDIKRRIFRGNYVKREFINFVSDIISKPKIILEIGSKDAIQSIEFSKLFPKAKIYAFECNPPSIKTCIENTKNYKNIEIIPYAVFNKNEKIDFYPVSEETGASSLFKLNKEYAEESNFNQEEITVDTIRIDTWAKEKGINKIDLIWIDLQGVEYEAFEGMGELLHDVQAIYTEVEIKELYIGQKLMKDISKLLSENGFSLFKYTENPSNFCVNNSYNESSSKFLWGNAIYINNLR